MAGRPRSAAADRAILDAALHEYAANGFDGLCVDSVAARAGVAKATIYRRYSSKVDLVMAACTTIAEESVPVPDTGELRKDLCLRLGALRDVFATIGPVMRRLVAERGDFPELDVAHERFVSERRMATRLMLERACGRGEIAPGYDVELVTDQLSAPLFYRLFVHGELVDDEYIDQIVDAVLAPLL
jgi:AcrR family transcriptional regulator